MAALALFTGVHAHLTAGPFKERMVSMAKVEIFLLRAIIVVSRFFWPALHAAALSSVTQSPRLDRPRTAHAFSPASAHVSPGKRLRRAA